MGSYKNTAFDYSQMSERITFQIKNKQGEYTDSIRVWAHFFKDGFTRTEDMHYFKIMVRDQKKIHDILERGNRIKWRKKLLTIFSWQDPSYEDRGFIEIIAKQITNDADYGEDGFGEGAGSLYTDRVSIYNMITTPTTEFGITTYEYDYDFSVPNYQNIPCTFATDRNRYLDDKRTDTEHDSCYVYFPIGAPLKIEDYITSSIHGTFKVDMICKTEDNQLEALVQRREVQ